MMNEIKFVAMCKFIDAINALREAFPEFAKELDKCLFEVMSNHTPKCGHGNCSCQTTTLEQFHRERNMQFGTTNEAKPYEEKFARFDEILGVSRDKNGRIV